MSSTLRAALEAFAGYERTTVPFDSDMLNGKVVIARHGAGADGDSALVFVVGCDGDQCEILLCHNGTTMACESDRVLSGADTGLGYDLVVQTDVHGWTFADDIGDVLATFPTDALTRAPRGLRGPNSPLDSRWEHKRREVRRFARLTDGYLQHLLAGDSTDGRTE
jgi:hypothetical protein